MKKRAKKEEFEVEAILGHVFKKSKLYLGTKYKGIRNPTNQPIEDFVGYERGKRVINELAEKYLKSKGLEI